MSSEQLIVDDATFGLKAGEWLRLGRFIGNTPDYRGKI
jgi:hypothetical protein